MQTWKFRRLCKPTQPGIGGKIATALNSERVVLRVRNIGSAKTTPSVKLQRDPK